MKNFKIFVDFFVIFTFFTQNSMILAIFKMLSGITFLKLRFSDIHLLSVLLHVFECASFLMCHLPNREHPSLWIKYILKFWGKLVYEWSLWLFYWQGLSTLAMPSDPNWILAKKVKNFKNQTFHVKKNSHLTVNEDFIIK